jgi:hypothetical protein
MWVSSVIKSIEGIIRKDAGVESDAFRADVLVKVFNAQEEELELAL